MFLAVLRLICALKMKIAPQTKIAPPKIGEDLFFLEIIWFWTKKRSEFRWRLFVCFFWRSLDFGEKTLWISVKTFFFVFLEITWFWTEKRSEFRWRPFFYFFWRSLDFGEKNALNFGEDLFFSLEITWFWKKNALNFGEDLFFWDHLILDRKTPWIFLHPIQV